ncbi:MAG: phosphodiesterase [Pseudomonadota bacterium]
MSGSDLTVIEVARNGRISAAHAVGTAIFGREISEMEIEGSELVSQIDSELADALKQGVSRAIRSRQLVRFRYEDDYRNEHYVLLPQGRERVLICATDATDVTQAMADAQKMMSTDAATGLPNGTALAEQLALIASSQRVREGRLAVLAVYAGRFDEQCFGLSSNEQDQVLVELARRLQRQVRGSNQFERQDLERLSIVARTDYRQLTVLLPDINGGEDAQAVADRLVTELSDPFELQRRTVYLSPRIGVALFPQDGQDAQSLISAADAAMEQAREAPDACSVMHSGTVAIRTLQRLDLASELSNALEAGRFQLRYQPIFDADSNRIGIVEAFLRWPDTLLANQPAQQILSLAEKTGVIVDIGEWVIRTACEQLAVWRTQLAEDLRIGINLSSQEFASTRLADVLSDAARCAEISLASVDLDVREHLVARDLRQGGAGLNTLAETGARIVLEGFGNGHCGMHEIAASPVSAIKVAQPLARDAAGLGIRAAKASVSAALALAPTVIATGIESAEQAQTMRELGCHGLQGFYFGRPAMTEEIGSFFQSVGQESLV